MTISDLLNDPVFLVFAPLGALVVVLLIVLFGGRRHRAVSDDERHEIAQNIRSTTAENYPRILTDRGADYAAGWSYARMRIADELEGIEG